jgi:hypothetical protein
MNIDYWIEQIKATTAIAARLATQQNLQSHIFLPCIMMKT